MGDLDRFIATLRLDRVSRGGPGAYASDKVYALLDEIDRLRFAAVPLTFAFLIEFRPSGAADDAWRPMATFASEEIAETYVQMLRHPLWNYRVSRREV